MSIQKEYGYEILTCDICIEPKEHAFDTWDEAIDYKKEKGWKAKKNDNEWLDICPDCQKIKEGKKSKIDTKNVKEINDNDW